MVKEWWQKIKEADRKKRALNKKKRETMYEASQKNKGLSEYVENQNSSAEN